MIETSWLRAFGAFAEDANLSRAARRLHLSQPAVHAQIRRLSEALGAPLYRRSGRGLVLTPAGVEAAAFARNVEEGMADLASRLRGDDQPRRVVLAAGAGALLYVIGEGLRAFTKKRASRVELLTLDAGGAFDAVRSGIAHVGVAASEAPPDSGVVHELSTVEQALVVPRDHPLAAKRRVSLGDLAGERLIVPPPGRPHRVALDAALAARGVRTEIGAIARGWELSIHLVRLGFGVTIVNACCRLPRELVARPVRELPAVRYVAFTRNRPTAVAAELVQALCEHADDWRGP